MHKELNSLNKKVVYNINCIRKGNILNGNYYLLDEGMLCKWEVNEQAAKFSLKEERTSVHFSMGICVITSLTKHITETPCLDKR